ncbi:PREDICTED: puromycin-sensitive aminopeptidase-like isoform X6 [Branchiostoma belcheri]|uniref:Aminopeptidase n=1 Tax=Branchiostoma belcheri TaxID=7741 RepID=A0A6P4Y696_BRABE|nr:PREDICTED: puromycin-sensitive aminopeptidase-like isoform X6 [Branchiostoma belcheri]
MPGWLCAGAAVGLVAVLVGLWHGGNTPAQLWGRGGGGAGTALREGHGRSASMGQKKPFERLPQDVNPTNYALRLQPDLEKFTFTGREVISVQVQKATDKVVMNSVDITIATATYRPENDTKDLATSEIQFNKENETVTLHFPSALPTGAGELTLEFEGELNDKMKGFYRSKYTSPDGQDRFCAVTQFEATDARRAFPCWDEPARKATFDVTLVVPKDRVALSNMNVVEEKPVPSRDDLTELRYARTPVMSTYLLAFVVGEYDYVEGRDTDGVLVRVYTPVGKKEQGKFALEVAVKTLPFYKEYFKIPYPLPKIDLIAIADFAAGAMENWGLVTYRETALLIDPENSSSHAKQWVALVVGHELAHQWFGNLVTMEWWTHLWLNEGFASWIEYLCVDFCLPEYDIWTQFVSTDYTGALKLDALKNSHPIEVPVGHPDEVDEIFDTISYSKGASVIRMLHDFIGDEDFRKGMNLYLTKFMYKNTFTEDLWASLGQASGKPVDKIMSTWTKQMGFPVLEVSATQEGTSRVLKIKQSKFCAEGPSEDDSSLWMVPVSISTSQSPATAVKTLLLDQRETTVTIDNVKPDDWVKLNPGTVGFYRTQYSSDMLDRLLPAIKDQSLPPRDRLGIQNDLFALAKSGVASTVDILRVMEAFVNESNYTVWSDLAANIASLSTLLSGTDCYPNFKLFVQDLFKVVGEKLGWDPKDGEGHLDAMLRSIVLSHLGKYGHQATITEATKRLEEHISGTRTLHADLRGPVYATVLRHGDEQTYEQLLDLLRKADLHEEKVRILRSLGSVSQPQLIQRVLDFALSSEVRSQDTVFVIGGATSSLKGRELAWKFVQDRWDELHTRYQGGFLLARLVQFSTSGFVEESRAREVEEFFRQHPAPAAERTVQQSCENIRLNAAWLARDAGNISNYLKTRASL